MTLALTAAGASVGGILVGAWWWRPPPRRVRALVGVTGRGRVADRIDRPDNPGWWAVAALGRFVRARAGRPPDPGADRHLGQAIVVGVPAAAISPLLVVAVAAWWWAAPLVGRRRTRRRHDAAVLAELPEVVDLFVLAVGAGLTVGLAVDAVARHQHGMVGAALADVARRVALGARLSETLVTLPDALGDRVRPLASVLVGSERYGVALLPALERLSAETRLERRRAAEASARRIPVKLLFPLVLCTLPAFALLTVVPLLAGSLRSLRL